MVDKICKNCGLLKKHRSLGLCQNCYSVMMYHKHKTLYIKIRAFFKYYFTCLKCGQSKKYYAKELCKNCYYSTEEQRKKINLQRAKPHKKEQKTQYNKAYWIKNKEKEKIRQKEYRKKPEVKEREKERAKQRKQKGEWKIYHQKNKEERNKASSKWREENPNYAKNWANKNLDKVYNTEIRYLKKLGKIFNFSAFETKMALRTWSKYVREINGNQCQLCGETDKIEAHHIFQKALFPKMAFIINNGIPLCVNCHNESHFKKLLIRKK